MTLALHPADLSEAMTIVPYLGHVPDLIALELHDVYVVRLKTFACGRNRAADSSVRAAENSVNDRVIPNRINAEGSNLVMPVRHRRKHRLHPFRVIPQRRDVFQGVCLSRKPGVVMTIRPTCNPTFTRLTRIEKTCGGLFNVSHEEIPLKKPIPRNSITSEKQPDFSPPLPRHVRRLPVSKFASRRLVGSKVKIQPSLTLPPGYPPNQFRSPATSTLHLNVDERRDRWQFV